MNFLSEIVHVIFCLHAATLKLYKSTYELEEEWGPDIIAPVDFAVFTIFSVDLSKRI